jgi:hypothetical protein
LLQDDRRFNRPSAPGEIGDSRILGITTADETEKWEKVVEFAGAGVESSDGTFLGLA